MLYTQTVAPETLELLKRLESEPFMDSFSLAGGTALALYLGHRVSVDLDLFTPESFDEKQLEFSLRHKYGFQTKFTAQHTLKGTIGGVKIDCIAHRYKSLRPPHMESGLRLYDMEDIIAMKLAAISDDGYRLKDFIDMAFLSTRFSLDSMLRCFERKFPFSNVLGPVKGLLYFDDINFGEKVFIPAYEYSWENIALRLRDMSLQQDHVFDTAPLARHKDCREEKVPEDNDTPGQKHGRRR